MNLKINATVTLWRDAEGYWLAIETADGKSAAISLGECGGPLTKDIFKQWGDEQFTAALIQRRRKTGVKDATGRLIQEGDIINRHYNQHYGVVTGVIKWDAEKAAFVAEGVFEGGGGWKTLNLEDAPKYTVVGNVFQNADLLEPARQIR